MDGVQIAPDDQIHRDPRGTVGDGAADGAARLALEGNVQLQLRVFGGPVVQNDLGGETAMVDVRRDVNLPDGRFPGGFQIDGLPDAGDGRVPAAHQAPVPILLAPGLGAVRRVLHPQAQVVFAVLQKGRNVKMEGRIATAMGSGLLAVHIDGAGKIHRTEMKQDPAAPQLFRQREAAAIPHDGMNFVRGTDAAHFGLVGEGNQNFFVQLLSGLFPSLKAAFVRIVKGKLPRTVQIDKGIAHKVGAGMFGAGDRHGEFLLRSFWKTSCSLQKTCNI